MVINRNKETGHLEIEPIEAQVVKEYLNYVKKDILLEILQLL